MLLPTAVMLVAVAGSPVAPPQIECYDYDLFADVVDRSHARLTQTIETPSFPTFRRLMIVTMDGTKQVFGAHDDCVEVPALFTDAPAGMKVVPHLELLPPLRAAG
jgi:hypothetical protein